MAKTVYRRVDTHEEAIALGFPNVASYRHAVRMEIAREQRQAYADAVGQHHAELAEKLQTPGYRMYTGPQTTMQTEVARARAADAAARGDGQ